MARTQSSGVNITSSSGGGSGGGTSNRPLLNGLKVSNNVRVVGKKVGANRAPVQPGKMTEGAAQARTQNVTRANIKPGKADARGLKAANKPTNKVGSKADKEIRSRTKSVILSKEETKELYDHHYGKGTGDDVVQINKRVTPKNESRSVNHQPRIGGHAK